MSKPIKCTEGMYEAFKQVAYDPANQQETARDLTMNAIEAAITVMQAQQHQGEPVPITNDMHRLMEAYRQGEFTAEGGADTIEALAVASFDTVADHGHDADSYMAGFCASLYWQTAPFIGLALKTMTHADPGEVERLRAELTDEAAEHRITQVNRDRWRSNYHEVMQKLAERDALLREAHDLINSGYLGSHDSRTRRLAGNLRDRIKATLSASEEIKP